MRWRTRLSPSGPRLSPLCLDWSDHFRAFREVRGHPLSYGASGRHLTPLVSRLAVLRTWANCTAPPLLCPRGGEMLGRSTASRWSDCRRQQQKTQAFDVKFMIRYKRGPLPLTSSGEPIDFPTRNRLTVEREGFVLRDDQASSGLEKRPEPLDDLL